MNLKFISLALVACMFAATSYAIDSYPPTPCEPVVESIEPCTPIQSLVEPCAPVQETIEPCAPCQCASCRCPQRLTKIRVERQIVAQRETKVAAIPCAVLRRVFPTRRVQTTRTVKVETIDR